MNRVVTVAARLVLALCPIVAACSTVFLSRSTPSRPVASPLCTRVVGVGTWHGWAVVPCAGAATRSSASSASR